MAQNGLCTIHSLKNGRLQESQRRVVEEYPLRVRVNGRDLATLVCSPQNLNFLLAGFFRLQGFIESLDDILFMGVCDDYGLAEVRLRGDIPTELRSVLTSGCGTGISFNLPVSLLTENNHHDRSYSSAALLRLMRALQGLAEKYRDHGGIHSAAIGDKDGLLLYAEDIGRHNTLDRLAGEALFRELDLRGTMLVSSGRISSEMVIKAARLGIGLIASRTTPSDQAVRLCRQAGITLVGYLRAERFEVFSHPEHLTLPTRRQHILGVSGVILAGGESRRMGSDKSLLPLAGARFIERLYRTFAELFDEVIIVTNSPGLYADLPCRKVPDIYRAQGSLAGIHAGLAAASRPRIFVAGCDMPLVNPTLVRRICDHAPDSDVVIPRSSKGHEPLHAVYAKSCLASMTAELAAGRRRIVGFFPQVRVTELHAELWRDCDPQELSFRNVNTPEEYFALRGARPGPPAETARTEAGPG